MILDRHQSAISDQREIGLYILEGPVSNAGQPWSSRPTIRVREEFCGLSSKLDKRRHPLQTPIIFLPSSYSVRIVRIFLFKMNYRTYNYNQVNTHSPTELPPSKLPHFATSKKQYHRDTTTLARHNSPYYI